MTAVYDMMDMSDGACSQGALIKYNLSSRLINTLRFHKIQGYQLNLSNVCM